MKECNVKVGDTVYIWHSKVKEMSKGIYDFNLGRDGFNEYWFTIESLRRGYREVTGLDNDYEFTDEELVEYMTEILERD